MAGGEEVLAGLGADDAGAAEELGGDGGDDAGAEGEADEGVDAAGGVVVLSRGGRRRS